jgi:hypothetical protein
MHKFRVPASALAVTAVTLGLAASPALASHTPSGVPRHAMTISFAAGLNSSAHWVRRHRAVLLRVGTQLRGPTEFAEIVVHHFPEVAPATEPTFAATGPRSPFLLIGFSGGGYLTRTTGDGSTAWTAYDPTGTILVSATSYPSALAAEQGASSDLTVDMVTVTATQVTLGPAFTETITALQYNGASLVPHAHHQSHHRR